MTPKNKSAERVRRLYKLKSRREHILGKLEHHSARASGFVRVERIDRLGVRVLIYNLTMKNAFRSNVSKSEWKAVFGRLPKPGQKLLIKAGMPVPMAVAIGLKIRVGAPTDTIKGVLQSGGAKGLSEGFADLKVRGARKVGLRGYWGKRIKKTVPPAEPGPPDPSEPRPPWKERPGPMKR